MPDLKAKSTQQLAALANDIKEELRLRAITENTKKTNKFNSLVKLQTEFVRDALIHSVEYAHFMQIFAPSHSTGACLDDSPHKDIVIGGCPCARCTLINMRNGTNERTALIFSVITQDKF